MDQRDLEDLAQRLRREYGALRIFLYGSYADGTAGPDSDLDLLIISPARESFYRRMAAVRRLLRGTRYGGSVSPIVLTPGELQARVERGDQFIGGILRRGLEL